MKKIKKVKKTKKVASPLSRRQAFRRLAAEAITLFDESRGQQHCAFNKLDELEKEQLEKIIPVIDRSWNLDIEDNWLVASKKDNVEVLRLFELSTENNIVFNRINGSNNLKEITSAVEENFDWDEEKSFKFVKQMFFHLANLKICSIANPLEE